MVSEVASTGSPCLSVVMATYNRAETLRQTIDHLVNQDLSPESYEVIIIDDGSPDATPQVVEEARSRVPFALTYLRHPNRGIGYTQNRGIEIARAPIILLMADDIFMTRGALSSHLAMHDANPEPEIAVLGRVEQPPDFDEGVFMRTWNPMRFGTFKGQRELPYYRFWACNISAKRDFVQRYGPFRENLGRGGPAAHEDSELGYRLHKGGLRIFYNPQALGHHHHVVTLKKSYARSYERGLNFGEFHGVVPEPEISVAYHVLNARTFGEHMRAWFGPRRAYLVGGDRNPALTILRHLFLLTIFNRVTVPLFWTPFLDGAEKSPFLARLVNSQMYRGAMFHHFLRGYRDAFKKFSEPKPLGGPSPQTQ